MTTEERVVVTPDHEIVTALIRLGVVEYGGPVVRPDEVTREHVAGKIVVGSLAPRIAVAAAEVWEPEWALTAADHRRERLGADELRARYRGLTAWRVREVKERRKATLIATGDPELVDLIRHKRLAAPDARVTEHAEVENVGGHVVIGTMPLLVAAAASFAIEVELELPHEPADRKLAGEEMRACYRGVTRYRVYDGLHH